MKYRIAIDGACRRNGKLDCISAGGLLLQRFSDDGNLESSYVTGVTERESTNQRGELFALIKALSILVDSADADEAVIITDSEYIFNAMTKGWVTSWESKGYITAEGSPVKNSDLWKHIYKLHSMVRADVQFYHIKGHTIPFGKVTAENLISTDCTGRSFCEEFGKNYDSKLESKADVLKKANELSVKNNGFELDASTLKEFITLNAAADTIATILVDKADSEAQS